MGRDCAHRIASSNVPHDGTAWRETIEPFSLEWCRSPNSLSGPRQAANDSARLVRQPGDVGTQFIEVSPQAIQALDLRRQCVMDLINLSLHVAQDFCTVDRREGAEWSRLADGSSRTTPAAPTSFPGVAQSAPARLEVPWGREDRVAPSAPADSISPSTVVSFQFRSPLLISISDG